MTNIDTRSSKTALKYWGHAALSVYAENGSSLLIDPYESGGFNGAMRYSRIHEASDWAVATHGHADHSAFDSVIAEVVDSSQETVGPFRIKRTRANHDEYDGMRFGGFVDMMEISVDSYRILHLSDVGEAPSPEQLGALRGADIVLVPIGGFYTMGAAQAEEWVRRIGAGCVIPIHYKTDRCDLPIAPADPFLTRFVEYSDVGSSFIFVRGALSLGPVVTLAPAGSKTN